MKVANQLPEEIMALTDQFLRDMTRLGAGVFGLVYVTGDDPAMAVLRNRQEDPVEQAEVMLSIIKGAAQDGRIISQEVKPLN